MDSEELKPLIVIVGETASGKSKLAIKLAKKFNGEIINADSWSVYKGFDIGTAKPTIKDREQVKHHLIDIAEPNKGFNAAKYQRLAAKKILEIQTAGKLPLLVGGTGLYIDSIIFNYGFLPPSRPNLRPKYNAMELIDLLEEVQKQNYNTQGIDLNNKRRVIRLIENKGTKPSRSPLRPNTLIIGIKVDPEKLKTNITKRVNNMLRSGLENEVKSLANQYSWEIEPMKGIGYREFRNYFEGKINLSETKAVIIKDSLDLAKKQRTWFKQNKSIQWAANGSEVVGIATTFMNNLSGK